MVALNIRRHSLGQRLKGNPKFSMGYILIQRAVAYELAIPPDFAAVYPIFHVFMLRKYIPDPSHVLRWDSIYPNDQLTFVEETVLVLASDMRQLHTREILVVKIQWRHRPVEEDTWEIESETWSQYPHLFETSGCIVDSIACERESFKERKGKTHLFVIYFDSSSSITDIVDDEIVEVSVLPNLEDVVVRGLDDDLELIVERLRGRQSDLDIVTISGMGGIGKTTLARKTHDLLSIRYHFDLRVWVTISQEYRSRNVLLDALHCISKQPNSFIGEDYDKKDDNELADLVQKKLKGRRYLVVVDDIWSTGDWDRIRRIFPDCNNRSRVLLTTRDTEVAMYVDSNSPHHMTLLNLDNSWKLLCEKVFGPEHDHPPELEEIGKRIAEKCQGLPLTISVIEGYLSKMTRTLESWNSFPEDFQFETCILIQLWIAEDFISAFGSSKSLEEVVEDYLEDLISRNLIMVRKRRFNGEIKSCGIHDLLREFCLNEAEMTNFMHVKSTNPTLPTPKHNVCRFNFQTQTHLVEDCCKQLPPTARSIYLFCDYIFSKRWSSVKLEVFSRFNLLRVLAIFHEDVSPPPFPLAITKLFHLTYLSIRCRGKLPASMAALQNLQTLVMDGFNIILPGKIGKIWMTKKLRHIHVGGYYSFPSRRRETIRNIHLPIDLPNLVELSRPYYSNCTNEVFSAIPNLKRLNVYVRTITSLICPA
ncbi:hypothetical protein BC332_27811 [Capsicum chinense]|nr:hypothetical protein BC332_27811 [Capsicum chinense]